jgi:hypothetical protein
MCRGGQNGVRLPDVSWRMFTLCYRYTFMSLVVGRYEGLFTRRSHEAREKHDF